MSLPSNYGGVDFSAILDGNSDDEQDDDECINMLEEDTIMWLRYCNMLGSAMLEYLSRLRQPQPSRFPNIRNGHMFMLDCLEQPSGQICFQEFRMYPPMLRHFSHVLRDIYGLRTENNVDVYEQVGMFLSILAHGKGYRQIQTRFGHSLYTISRYFRKVLAAVVSLGGNVIKPNPNYNQSPIHHKPDPVKHRLFKDCIGAIDGTHIEAVLPAIEKLNFIGRKGYPTQNVLAVCDLNRCFTFVLTGTSGKMHDSYILSRAIHDLDIHFPQPGPDKYYLVDSRFTHRRGYMAPFKGPDVRYHFQEFRSASSSRSRRFWNYRERFNFYHSSCRNVIERSFGVLKERCKILDRMPHYPFEIQTAVVVATMTIHNVLRRSGHIDQGFRSAELLDDAAEIDLPGQEEQDTADQEIELHGKAEWNALREHMARQSQ